MRVFKFKLFLLITLLNNNSNKNKIVGLKFACQIVNWGCERIRHKKSIKFDVSNLKIFNRYRYVKKHRTNKRILLCNNKFDKL